MNLSPLEITIDDCETKHTFNILIKNKNHALMLVNRWVKIGGDFILSDKDLMIENIGNTLAFRSPIMCQAPGFKLCKKCFGEYAVAEKKFVGIHVGQCVSERLTQLSMRSFHTSGSATLEIDNDLKNFIQEYLVDINNTPVTTTLTFSKDIPDDQVLILSLIMGYEGHTANTVTYNYNTGIIDNLDVGAIIKTVNKCLQTENSNIKTPEETYDVFMSSILSVGEIYSSFIELILSILYVDEDNEIIRYQLKNNKPISIKKKYSIKEVHKILSPVLSLLYVPNRHTIKKYYESVLDKENYIVSIYEKIWLDVI